ncbi:acyltransferase [Pseudolysobacter antarcticus]|uniref:Acyltransferase n=1 Tax=Pseudolysobacter antarcticus TaxID=2511995 RepID=A0A411HKH8_9GAMM|nr:acyltransferase family protein [Pseudolysobacter antarcticus]QBB70998.1 acyltransferase [Pseudolysobacter antarcticus]
MTTRRYDIDALRVIAFALLILYHVCMLYVADWGWHVKSQYQNEWLQWPMIFLNRWRMSLLFLISGLAIGLFNPAGAAGRFALSRTWRLFLPLLFGMFFIVPVQPYCQGVSNGLVEPGFGAFMLRYWSFQPWPKDAFDGWQYGITWNHLWYLAYLWVYTLLLCVLLPALESSIGKRLQAAVCGLRGAGLIVLPALPLVLYLTTLAKYFPTTNDLIHDWFQHALYFSVLLYGYVMACSTALWQELLRLRHVTLALALVIFAIYVAWNLQLGEHPSDLMVAGVRCMRGFYLWTALLTILGWGHALLNRPFRWLPYATEAVFPWYVLHQSLIVLVAYWLIPLHLGPVLEPVLVIIATVGGCALLHEFVIRRTALLRPLFGLKSMSSRRPFAAPAVAVIALASIADDVR